MFRKPCPRTIEALARGLGVPRRFDGIESQPQEPLAQVLIAGITLAPVLILIIMPVLINLFSRRISHGEEAEGSAEHSPVK